MFLNTLEHRSFDTVENNKNSDFYLAVNHEVQPIRKKIWTHFS
jgi:hypothetical protein